MYLNYYPILIIQIIVTILIILIWKKRINKFGYLRLYVANLALCVAGLYVIPLRLTNIHLFAVAPNLIPFQNELNIIEISYLIMPFILITILLCLLFSYEKSFKAIFIATGMSLFIQFLAFAIQSQKAEITFILIQVLGGLIGYLLYRLIYNNIGTKTIARDRHK